MSSYADVLEINAEMMENLTTEEKETLLALIRKLGSGSQG